MFHVQKFCQAGKNMIRTECFYLARCASKCRWHQVWEDWARTRNRHWYVIASHFYSQAVKPRLSANNRFTTQNIINVFFLQNKLLCSAIKNIYTLHCSINTIFI